MIKNKGRPTDGLVRQNIVLMSGLLIGPVIAGSVDFYSAAAISLMFSLVTFLSVMLCRFVPRKMVYTVRIILYALVASVLYIPAYFACEFLLGTGIVSGVGIYLPILVTNHVILSKTETRLFHLSYGQMLLETLGYVAGFAIVCMITGIIRDVFVNSAIGNTRFSIGLELPALETTFGGFIIVGILAGLCRALYNFSQKRKEPEPEGGTDK